MNTEEPPLPRHRAKILVESPLRLVMTGPAVRCLHRCVDMAAVAEALFASVTHHALHSALLSIFFRCISLLQGHCMDVLQHIHMRTAHLRSRQRMFCVVRKGDTLEHCFGQLIVRSRWDCIGIADKIGVPNRKSNQQDKDDQPCYDFTAVVHIKSSALMSGSYTRVRRPSVSSCLFSPSITNALPTNSLTPATSTSGTQ
ncbi:hypothetical protein H206_05465 [Candidatus Electrothrix aarhusensis]|uniref:Uncharacterized protein n=1 Tax=Candidatus Electrothrix aarhusensis TaxID=1859131 RepID=A0A3S3SQS6_9BACT|nr:hypothetical protein H206_05465 [Candidatus Electrothrix aarhusensis]